MPLIDVFKSFVSSVDTEYDRRIRGASNVKEYHPEGHGHHGHALGHDDHDDHEPIEEEGGGSGSEGALQGAGGTQYAKDPGAEKAAQH